VVFKRKQEKPQLPRKGAKSANAIIRYFQETRDELRKVTWASREETFRLTLIVLGATAASMVFLGLLDFLFQRLAGLLT
jgi:preprotein translocase subunit SecE